MAKGKTQDTTDESDAIERTPATLEERVAHLEDVLSALLTAHGETYVGAGAHLETLDANRDAR